MNILQKKKKERKRKKTRPDTRPISVADGWAGAEMRGSTFRLERDGPTHYVPRGRHLKTKKIKPAFLT